LLDAVVGNREEMGWKMRTGKDDICRRKRDVVQVQVPVQVVVMMCEGRHQGRHLGRHSH